MSRTLNTHTAVTVTQGQTPGPGQLHGTHGSCYNSLNPMRVYLLFPQSGPALLRAPSGPKSPFPACPGGGFRARCGQLPPAPGAAPGPHPRLSPARPGPARARPALTAGAAPRGSRGPARPPPAPCWGARAGAGTALRGRGGRREGGRERVTGRILSRGQRGNGGRGGETAL